MTTYIDGRYGATLPGGLVLVAGGDDFDDIPLLNAELYAANKIFRGAFESP